MNMLGQGSKAIVNGSKNGIKVATTIVEVAKGMMPFSWLLDLKTILKYDNTPKITVYDDQYKSDFFKKHTLEE